MATNMDLADKIELDQIVTFNLTKTTWSITERLSPYPDCSSCYSPKSDSFQHSYVFRVELGGTSAKVLPENIPKTAVLKIKSNASVPKDAINVDLLNEIRALQQLTLNGSNHAPTILDAKVEHHLTSLRNFTPPTENQTERQHFVTYILMTEMPGLCLKGNAFWKLEQDERRTIRRAFRTALTDIHRSWVILSTPDPKHLIWNRATQIISIVNFEKAHTFNNLGLQRDEVENIAHSLPTRFQKWQNKWYADWGLSKDVIGVFTKSTDGTVFDDENDEFMARYSETVLQEPKMPADIVSKKLVGPGGSDIGEHPERKEYMEQLAKFHNLQEEECCEVM